MNNKTSSLLSFPLALCRFRLIAATPILLPEWSGSLLRGAFGHALRQLSCMTRQKDCASCPLYRTCPYPALFAPPAVEHQIQHFSQPPAPYLIEPERWGAQHLKVGDRLQFNMVLMGRALDEFPLIVEAWKRAAGRGLGPTRGDQAGTAELDHIDYLPQQGIPVALYRRGNRELTEIPLQTPLCPPRHDPCRISLQFISPLRLQRNGHPLDSRDLKARDLLMALVRRVALLHEFHGAAPLALDFSALAHAAETISSEKELHWQDWTRYSSRQQQKMALGGVVGRWTLSGEADKLAPFFPFLHLGQWLHVGKEATFGLGGYRVEGAAAEVHC
jgi:hypothetical protein